MKIYTGQCSGDRLEIVKKLGMGIMISSSPITTPEKVVKETYCALDNGAYSCYKKGYPFMQEVFIKQLQDCYKKNIPLDFIVCPDIVAGGKESYDLSMRWAYNELRTAPKLALVVQDGLSPKDVGSLNRFTHIFVGGSVEWKWKTAEEWINFGHSEGKQVHIGQCGRLEYLLKAYELKADSVDSTSFTRNNSFSIVEEYYNQINGKTLSLFEPLDNLKCA